METKKNYIRLKKTFTFKRTHIDVGYEITNISDTDLEALFGTEINLALSSYIGRDVEISVFRQSTEIRPKNNNFSYSNVNVIKIDDNQRKVNIMLTTTQKSQLWGSQLFTNVGTGRVVEPLYQFDCIMPTWEIRLAPGKSWNNNIQLKIERMQKKTKISI